MTKAYKFSIEPGFLNVVCAREVTAKTMQHFCEKIPKLGRRAGISKILLDKRNLPISLNTSEYFQCATEIAENFRGLMLAIVIDPPLTDSQRFEETVARNRGASIRLFNAIEEAYEWLGVKPANHPDNHNDK
jgi:hypothetical protein